MAGLSSHDTRKLLAAVEALNSDFDPKTLPERSVEFLYAIVGNEMSNLDFFSPEGRYDLTAWTDRTDLFPKIHVFKQFVHQHPAIPLAISDSTGMPYRITDGMAQSEFRNTELYNEYFREIPIDYQMGLAMPVAEDLTVCAAVARGGQRDFTDNERVMLRLGAPHLLNALRFSLAYDRLSSALESVGAGVVALLADGSLSFVSEFAGLMLERYFPEDSGQTGLPSSLAAWVEQQRERSGNVHRPKSGQMRVRNGTGSLCVRCLENRQTREITLILEEKRDPTIKALLELGLTTRETEILYWMSRGKADAEIALLCGISVGTARKHAQNIYIKLGVESRTAAMLKAMTVIR
jgi:DNA-binding CsgD family transcriptional regulator